MTTEPREHPTLSSRPYRSTPSESSTTDDAREAPDLTDGLDRGAVERLRLEPARLTSRLAVGGAESLRVHNSVATARLAFEHASWELDAGDRLHLRTESGESTLQLDRWSFLYRDRETERLLAYDRFGELKVELALADWGAELNDRPDELTHRAQRPPAAASTTISEFEVHNTTLDDETFPDAWVRCESFAETRHLERAARTHREELLLQLPCELTRALSPDRVAQIVGSLPDYEDEVEVVVEGRGHRTRLSTADLQARARKAVLLGIDERRQFAFDRRRIGGAYLVELPGETGALRALELVDGAGRFAARLQRRPDATPSRILSWRASLQSS